MPTKGLQFRFNLVVKEMTLDCPRNKQGKRKLNEALLRQKVADFKNQLKDLVSAKASIHHDGAAKMLAKLSGTAPKGPGDSGPGRPGVPGLAPTDVVDTGSIQMKDLAADAGTIGTPIPIIQTINLAAFPPKPVDSADLTSGPHAQLDQINVEEKEYQWVCVTATGLEQPFGSSLQDELESKYNVYQRGTGGFLAKNTSELTFTIKHDGADQEYKYKIDWSTMEQASVRGSRSIASRRLCVHTQTHTRILMLRYSHQLT